MDQDLIFTLTDYGATISYYNGSTLLTNSQAQDITSSGAYTIKVEAAGCSDEEVVAIEFNDAPSFNLSSSAAICEGTLKLSDEVTSLTSGATLQFATDPTFTSISNDVVSVSGEYFVRAEANGCVSDYQSIDISVSTNPELFITDPSSVCAPSTVDITTSFIDLNGTNGTVSYYETNVAPIVLSNPSSIS